MFFKKLLQPFVVHVVPKVLDVDICKLFGLGTELSLPLFAGFETTHEAERQRERDTKHL